MLDETAQLLAVNPPCDKITDVWFRSPAELEEIVAALGLSGVSYDDENYWEWAIGTLDGVRLDVTRTHLHPAASVDTRIFRLDDDALISSDLLAKLTERVRIVTCGPVSWGRWVYRGGNDFDLQVVGRTEAA